jgi:hypothetical protein
MPAFQKFNSFPENLGRKVYNLHTDTLKIMLTNVAPVAGNSVKADITEIAAGNGYVAGGAAVPNTSFTQAGGIATLLGDDPNIIASGGSIGPYQWAVLYDDTAVNDELIGFWDYGGPQTLLAAEQLQLDLDATGILDVQ